MVHCMSRFLLFIIHGMMHYMTFLGAGVCFWVRGVLAPLESAEPAAKRQRGAGASKKSGRWKVQVWFSYVFYDITYDNIRLFAF